MIGALDFCARQKTRRARHTARWIRGKTGTRGRGYEGFGDGRHGFALSKSAMLFFRYRLSQARVAYFFQLNRPQVVKGTTMLFVLGIFVVAILHFVTSFFLSFGAGISQSKTLKLASYLLTFPLQHIPNGFKLPGLLDWLPWVIVSLCWGWTICTASVRLAQLI